MMTDRENPSAGSFPHPPKNQGEKELSQVDAERLRLIGEFLVNTSSLIEAIHTQELADDITYGLTFPVLPGSRAILPGAVQGVADISTIEINASHKRPSAPSPEPTSLRIVIQSPTQELTISRAESTDTIGSSSVDTLMDTTQKRPELSLRDELRLESDEDFQSRLSSVKAVPQKEINALLLSLALPESYGDALYSAQAQNLMDDATFLWLLESLRHQAMSTRTSGTYSFGDQRNATLLFNRTDSDSTLLLKHTNPITGEPLIAYADTAKGMRLDFSTYVNSAIFELQPTNEDIALLNDVVVSELGRLAGEDVHGEVYRDGDPEQIVEERIAEEKAILDDLEDRFFDIPLD